MASSTLNCTFSSPICIVKDPACTSILVHVVIMNGLPKIIVVETSSDLTHLPFVQSGSANFDWLLLLSVSTH